MVFVAGTDRHHAAVQMHLQLQRNADAEDLLAHRVKAHQHDRIFPAFVTGVQHEQDRIDIFRRDDLGRGLHDLELIGLFGQLVVEIQCNAAENEQRDQNGDHERDRGAACL